MSTPEKQGGKTATSLIVMGCTLISRILGFVRQIVVTTFFSGEKADIINFAFSIPNNLRKLLAEGALSSAFIPVLSANLVKTPDGSKARRLVASIINLQIVVILPICLLSIVFSDFLVSEVLSEFDNPAKLAAAAKLFRWLIGYLLLISISAVLMGVLNSHRLFVIPAITPLLFSVCVIASISLLRGHLDIYAMAFGVLTGGAAQIAFQYPLFRKLGYSFKLVFDRQNAEFRKVTRQWLPILATSSVFTITQQIAIKFASGLSEGSVTSVGIALTFFQLPFGIFSASITTVLFPRMSRQAALKDIDGLRESFQYGLRFLLVMLLPSAVFLCLNAKQLVGTGFLKGEFSFEDVVFTAPVLVYYGVGLVSVGCFTFVQRFFYSLHEYRIPFLVAFTVAVVDILLSLWLKETILETGGIALANSISFTFGTIVMICLARKRIGVIEGRKIFVTLLKVTASVAPAIAVVFLFNSILGSWWERGRSLISFLLIFTAAGLFILPVLLGFYLTKVEMLESILNRFRRAKP